MTREQREQELNRIRQADPAGLVAAYREATNTPTTENLPRGMGFPGMIAVILEREFGSAKIQCDSGPVNNAVQQFRLTTHGGTTLPAPPARRCRLRDEITACCSGAALVCLGLLMAACYVVAKH
jgi:hypothetical protein